MGVIGGGLSLGEEEGLFGGDRQSMITASRHCADTKFYARLEWLDKYAFHADVRCIGICREKMGLGMQRQ